MKLRNITYSALLALPLLLSAEINQALSATPAFPGAEGHGAVSVGGRGGKVIEVTNLNDSGLGSLRAAIEQKGPRIVVFRVGGTINLQSKLRIRNPYITIAGQTAPGGGILLRSKPGYATKMMQIDKEAHDVIIRYLRFRTGSGVPDGNGVDNLTINGGYNIILDRISVSWSTDENISLYRQTSDTPISNVTIQNSIIAEGLAGHSCGLIIGGHEAEWKKISEISIHRNLFSSNSHRNPRIAGFKVQVANNVLYNWKARMSEFLRGATYDYVNNYGKVGPMRYETLKGSIDYLKNNLLLYYHVDSATSQLFPNPSIYTAGNIVVPGILTNASADNWQFWKMADSKPTYQGLPLNFRRLSPLSPPQVPVKLQSAYDAYNTVIADVGANARLDENGKWIPNLDTVDKRIIADVKNGTGPKQEVANPSQVGGWPLIANGTPYADSDRDGMPDSWERLYNLNPNNLADGNKDNDSDGYTNVEEFLNGTNPLL